VAARLTLVVACAACAFEIGVLVTKDLAEAAEWAAVVTALAGVLAAAAAVWAVTPRPPVSSVPSELRKPDWAVERPAELAAVVKALVRGKSGTAGITVGLYGAGGFGKSTLALMAGTDRQVRDRFGGRVFWVTVGQDRGVDAITKHVNDMIYLISGEESRFSDPEKARQHLGSVLNAGPRRLLIWDDVWDGEQLRPLAQGSKRCACLVTTRAPELLKGCGTAVQVDQMSPEQARQVLTSGLPPIDEKTMARLLAATGRWPLVLRLAGKILAVHDKATGDALALSAQAEELAGRLASDGPAAVDVRAGGLDVSNPASRAQAVWATISASTGLLDQLEAARFAELAVFASDTPVPFALVASLWRATAHLDDHQAAQLCDRLAQLALVTQARGVVVLHDVIRDFLRAEVGRHRLAELHAMLLDAVAAGLPAATPLDPGTAYAARVAWWELRDGDRYLWDHLIGHLTGAGRPGEAEAVATDLRWVAARLERSGPAAPAADLAAARTPRAARLREVLASRAHLLARAEPAAAVIDVLCNLIVGDPDWGVQAAALLDQSRRPRLVSRRPLPDLPGPAMRRVLTGHHERISLTIAPDSSFLTACSRREVRIWDPATAGMARAVLDPGGSRFKLGIAPDSSWLATASGRTVRIWDPVTGERRKALRGHKLWVSALLIAPDGTWLATASGRTVRIWDYPITGKYRNITPDRKLRVRVLVTAPDGTWLATASGRTVRIWDRASGERRAELSGHERRVSAIAVAPDGTWLATAAGRTIRIWDRETWKLRTEHTGPKRRVSVIAIAPDSAWLAVRSRTGWLPRNQVPIRIWEANGPGRASVPDGQVAFAPDSSWLGIGTDQRLLLWDPATRQERAVLTGHNSPISDLAVAPDGRWLATASGRSVRIWDPAAGQGGAVQPGGMHLVSDLAVAADGSWLAVSDGREVQILEVATGMQRAVLPGKAAAIAPDCSWLATSSSPDGDAAVRFRDPVTGVGRGALAERQRPARVLAVADANGWLATTGDHCGEEVRVWDPVTGQKRAVMPGRVLAVAPDSSWLAVSIRSREGHGGWGDTELRIWDAASGRARSLVFAARHRVSGVVIAPDASWLAIRSDRGKTVRIWDLASSQVFPAGYHRPDSKAAVAPDGSELVISKRRTARVWDPATGRRLARFKACKPGHVVSALVVAREGNWVVNCHRSDSRWPDRVMAIPPGGAWLAISRPKTTTWRAVPSRRPASMPGRILDIAPDGSWLATSNDRKIHIWDTATAQKRATISGFMEDVTITAIAPDSTLLATASRTRDDSDSDWTIQVWNPATGSALALMRVENAINACAWIGTTGLALGGEAGIYIFDFLTSNLS
jgi:WD40 repeat protein